ncbi:MAG: nuclear transport factor 2 family protein [Acidobacteriota bacterium]|nr:nuclear transport factor 2 family protein [Acidobacteriota bacterium]
MRNRLLFFITILSFAIIFSAACGGGSQPAANNTAATNGAGNTNTAVVTNSNSLTSTGKKPEAATTNNAPTLAPVVAAYYDALKKKDDAALRKVVSDDTLKTWEADMKEEKKTSLTAFLTELEPAPETPVEVRNEKIDGDSATAEIKGGSYAAWTPFKFVREGGQWKITNKSPDVQDMPKDAMPAAAPVPSNRTK